MFVGGQNDRQATRYHFMSGSNIMRKILVSFFLRLSLLVLPPRIGFIFFATNKALNFCRACVKLKYFLQDSLSQFRAN